MKLNDTLSIAFKGVTGNKLRAFLTILGVIIGVGAVIAVMSIGAGASAAITAQIESVGTNLIFIRPGATTSGGVRTTGSAQSLTLQDALAISGSGVAPDVAAVSPEVASVGQVKYGNVNTNTRISGVMPAYQVVNNSQIASGRFIFDQDVNGRLLVAVIGASTANTLFGDSDPIDQTMLIRQLPFRVVGVLAPKGGSSLGNADDLVLVPLTTAATRLGASRTSAGGQTVQSITVQAASKDGLEAAKLEIASVLRERHKIIDTQDDFTLTTQDDLVQARTQVANVLTLLLGSIAGISLVVGGIGIMNIMLVTVSERTREIGLRKAIGARRRDILAQFLTEATILSLTGGVLGVAAGWGASRLLDRLSLNGQQVQTLVSPNIAMIAMGVAVGIGLFFGIYPAMRASRLDPIEALRHQ